MLIVDSFAGGGGASTGIEVALGRSPDIAINHDEIRLYGTSVAARRVGLSPISTCREGCHRD